MDCAIVGSGIAGLAMAIRLANKGHDVMVYEKNPYPGGKIAEIRQDGYRFDTGPSVFTLPELVEELFRESGEDISQYFTYNPLRVSCKYFYPEGSDLTFYHDPQKLEAEVERSGEGNFSDLERHLRKAGEAYSVGAPVFLFSSPHKLSNYFTDPYRKVVFKLHKLDFFRSMHRANSKSFRDKKLVQIFDRYATYNGSDPYKAPATLNMIAHLENSLGAFFPQKGMYSLIRTLVDLAIRKGVRFTYNTKVDEIQHANGKVSGLKIGRQTYSYDLIISDGDIDYVKKNLLRSSGKRKFILKPTRSSSAMIFYWGIKKTFPSLDIHNILFSANYRKEFNSLFHTKQIDDDPTVYIFVSSKINGKDAPEGCENWFVMINVPPNRGQNWEELSEKAKQIIIKKINKSLNTKIEDLIESESLATPQTIEEKTLNPGGSLYGNASNSMFSAFLRQPNFSRKIKNLYFVGGSVHPGGGIPLCLAGCKIVDQEIPHA